MIQAIKHKAKRKIFSPLRFGRAEVPDRLIVKPIDPWPGCAQQGHNICSETEIATGGRSAEWTERLHRFFWLRDLRAMGGQDAKRCAIHAISNWIYAFEKPVKLESSKLAWRPDIVGERISTWISHYDFIANCINHMDEDFEDRFFQSLYYQSVTVADHAKFNNIFGLSAFKLYKGLLYAGLAFEGHEDWAQQALSSLVKETNTQILPDGGHISRSPMELMRAVQILLDVKAALAAAALPCPKDIQRAIERGAHALRFFQMPDKKLALMNGAHMGCDRLISTILAQAGMRGKGVKSLPDTGYERIKNGRTHLIFDGGNPPPFPHDSIAHAAPLAFELSYGRDRIFTSCGTHLDDENWQEMLRATAAHTTLTLNNRNAFEIQKNGHFSRKAQVANIIRHDDNGAALVESSHDGYLPLNGMVHKRMIYMDKTGHDIRGEDRVYSKIRLSKPADIAIRFHLHPDVMASMTQGCDSVLLRLKSGVGWRFKACVETLKLEDSIVCGDGKTPIRTQQIVIHAHANALKTKVKWALMREGI